MDANLKDYILKQIGQIDSPTGYGNIVTQKIISELIFKDKKLYFSINCDKLPQSLADQQHVADNLRKQIHTIISKIIPDWQIISTITANHKAAGSKQPANFANFHAGSLNQPATLADSQAGPAKSPLNVANHHAGAAANHKASASSDDKGHPSNYTARGGVSGLSTKDGAVKSPSSHPKIKHIIAVASGKGGVGKSTVAFNLSFALRKLGLKVGFLDADIYGPSLPTLLGSKYQPELNEENALLPLFQHSIEWMSLGFIMKERQAAIWRGPMLMKALRQMLFDVAWSNLDVLVVDMPPGTGDAHLTLVQQVKLSGSVIVSTPQKLALIDAERAIDMFYRVNVPILGLLENMSYFVAPDTGNSYDLFGSGAVAAFAKANSIDFLGNIPFYMALRDASDKGQPTFICDPQADLANILLEVAANIAQKLQLQ